MFQHAQKAEAQSVISWWVAWLFKFIQTEILKYMWERILRMWDYGIKNKKLDQAEFMGVVLLNSNSGCILSVEGVKKGSNNFVDWNMHSS